MMNGIETGTKKRRKCSAKILIGICLCAALLLTTFLFTGCATKNGGKKMIGTLTSGGKTGYRIVIPQEPSEAERFAADELSKYLGQITSAKFEIVPDSEPESEKEIVLGKTARGDFGVDYEDLGIEGFTIRTVGDKAEKVVIGGIERGLIYGVYEFLESYCGCRFYASDCEVVPVNKKLGVPAVDDTQKPAMEYRQIYWYSSFDPAFRMKRKVDTGNGLIGGRLDYEFDLCHTMARSIVSANKYFDEHPEYYALYDGEYHPTQLCLTNPDVYKIALEETRAYLSEHPGEQIFSLTQHDNCNPCRCPECMKVNNEEKSFAGTNMRFVNAIAEELKDEFPDVVFDTFAYQYTLVPPAITKPADNVIIRLCSIKCCTSHPLTERCSGGGVYEDFFLGEEMKDRFTCFDDYMKAWSEVCDRIYVWHYTTDFAYYVTPFPNYDCLYDDIKYFAEHNVRGAFIQGDFQSENCEFDQLRSYLIAKMLWNPYITREEFDAMENEFLEAYYGKGWKQIREYLDLTLAITDDVEFSLYTKPTEIIPLKVKTLEGIDEVDTSFVDQAEKLFEEAKKASAEDETALSHILRSEISLRYYRCFVHSKLISVGVSNARFLNKYGKITNEEYEQKRAELDAERETYRAECEQLFDDAMSFGLTRFCEGSGLPDKSTFVSSLNP